VSCRNATDTYKKDTTYQSKRDENIMSKKHISELAEALMDETAQWMCGISLTEELLAVKDAEIAALNGEIQKLMTGEINPDIHKIEEENKILKAKLNHRNKMLTCSRWIWMLGSALYSFFISFRQNSPTSKKSLDFLSGGMNAFFVKYILIHYYF
jgi:hypothetical protein